MKPGSKSCTIFSIGGGKGGVGKSVLSIGMATALAKEGKSVILVDLDLGAANLHTYLGLRGRTPTIADFILGKTPSLESILVETPVRRLGLISGAEFLPGITSPAHWMKLKLLRHLRALPADYVIIDLGAGVHFNTLDFFGVSDQGVIITAPEPGAVMNAYSFIKGALFRKVQAVFKNHPGLAAIIEDATKNPDSGRQFTLEWFSEKIRDSAPDMLSLVGEIEQAFRPALVINRAPEGRTHLLVKNLITLCKEKLGITLEHVGDLPEVREMSNYLLNVPLLLDKPFAGNYFSSVQRIIERLVRPGGESPARKPGIFDFSDEDMQTLNLLMDSLDDNVFASTSRSAWKLRLFFRPADVVSFLVSRGVTHELFYQFQ